MFTCLHVIGQLIYNSRINILNAYAILNTQMHLGIKIKYNLSRK